MKIREQLFKIIWMQKKAKIKMQMLKQVDNQHKMSCSININKPKAMRFIINKKKNLLEKKKNVLILIMVQMERKKKKLKLVIPIAINAISLKKN